jgi:hypothetical protein
MRHTGITNWVRTGVATVVVKQLAGYKFVVTTHRYLGELTREDLARIPSAFTQGRRPSSTVEQWFCNKPVWAGRAQTFGLFRPR